MPIYPYEEHIPQLAEGVFIAPSADVIGNVALGKGTSVWFGVTIRGDVNTIKIGAGTNIQDGTVCHVTYKKGPLVIGDNVTVGHNATLHACTLKDGAFVGMGATVMDHAVVESGAMVAAGALVPPGKVVKTGQVYAGVPATYLRDMTEEEKNYIPWSAQHYMRLGRTYLEQIENKKA